ncbi:MAG: polysaccharide deacetylase family protein [Bacteroidota bacterium]|nr:MAG: polysaccharide deacetylase family protein [Bacteroidota bacterium]
MLTIYSPQTGPRLQYVCRLVFETILQQPYILTNQLSEAGSGTINYSSQSIEGAFRIEPSGLLEQTGIGNHELYPGELDGIKTLFHHGKGDLKFDIFSAVFYLCSRYEEYLPHEPDEHGRYRAEDSVAYRYGFLQEPVVELWVKHLAECLKVPFPLENFQFQLTVDVDQAWKYAHRGFLITSGALLRDFFTGRWNEITNRIKVCAGFSTDPWDSYSWFASLEQKLSKPIRYFFLMHGEKPFDPKVCRKGKAFRKLVSGINDHNKAGLHPSYVSHKNYRLLSKEYYNLSFLMHNKPRHSRQHFLKFKLPASYEHLIKLGILEEHSMGYASQPGFRAGISRPFYWYNLPAEKESHLLVVPFVAMDRTLKDYLGLSPDEAFESLLSLSGKIKSIGGQFTLLWHNDSASGEGEWEGWKEVLEGIIGQAA